MSYFLKTIICAKFELNKYLQMYGNDNTLL